MNEKSLLKKLQNKDEKALEDIIDLYNAYVTTIVGMQILLERYAYSEISGTFILI